MASIAHKSIVPEERKKCQFDAEEPSSYFSNSPNSLEQLKTLTRVDVQQPYVSTEQGEMIFEFKREALIDEDRNLFFSLFDNMGRQVIRIKTGSTCDSPLEAYIHGQYVAKLHQKRKFFYLSLKYVVRDASGNKALMVYTPGFPQTRFLLRIKDLQGNVIGTITKKWKGQSADQYDDSKELQVEFPRDLEIQYKAIIIGLCINVVQASYLACSNIA